jgi:dTDP-4-amino-4,6-dideoxygalactose transaminase
MIPVTKPFSPPIDEYKSYLDQIWQRNWLTNDGPLVTELESKLTKHFNLTNLLYVSNGTIALQIAIKALELKGEIITTPFSYVATTSTIVWENCSPVFVDIDQNTCNINPELIEQAITSKTVAIIATHVYGNPCDIDSIQIIAKKHNLKVIYDAAHCFGSKYKNKSVLSYGDISTISFHATKLFHTVEGGAVITNNNNLSKKMALIRNFGHNGLDVYTGIGINGKNSEFHAAMGLVNLKYVQNILYKRISDYHLYNSLLEGLDLNRPIIDQNSISNYSYYPIIFRTEKDCLNVIQALKKQSIFARRYFYPILSELDYVQKQNTPIAKGISTRTLCLPFFEQITELEIKLISEIILKILKN